MSSQAILVLGFLLGMRHATDADHVAAVSTIVSRTRSLRAALPIGLLWGIGHTLTILAIGGAIILFGVAIPPRVGLGMEMTVAVMLILLGTTSILGVLRRKRQAHDPPATDGSHPMRPLVVGVVHGVAGSAAAALLVLGVIRDPWSAIGYLLVFGTGTIAGMVLITTAFAVPVAIAAARFDRVHRALGVATGLASVALGLALVHEIGIVQGLFDGAPAWNPR